jgi:hypothetical protein
MEEKNYGDMARNIENAKTLGVQEHQGKNQKYVYFGNPPELWVADLDVHDEHHDAILKTSQRKIEEVENTGMILFQMGFAKIQSMESMTLGFPEKSAKPVIQFLQQLSDVEADKII